VLTATLISAWQVGRKIHRPDPQFAVMAYGKLGGKELGYASDLDLIFIYDDSHEMAQEQYAKLAQRINVWLTTNTASGQLFEIDLRLRPNGNAGLLVSDLQGFIDYQRRQAWVWEHQALTRARWCAGDARIGRAFEQARCEILCLPREPAPLKHDRGGMVDIEFMVQALVLRYSHQHASLTGNIGNIALLHLAGQLGLIPLDLATAVANAYRELRRQQHRLRLAGAASARLDVTQAPLIAQAQRDVRDLWSLVFADAPAKVRRLSELHTGA
jgi:glutamate-ammonia-ligase adenylyltransferase